ncbi:MAG: hypothetical protein GXO65_06305 [Euryarchaeota archaeon]|nr:hypothetical protein [Euryarchaeota archaeon]
MDTVEEGSEFVFQNCFYLVELTGRKAGNLKEFFQQIQEVDGASIFYHFYHSMLEFGLVQPDYYNDFSYWLEQTLHEGELAEKIADPFVWEYNDIEDVRAYLISLIDDHLSRHRGEFTPPKPEIHEFHFRKAVAVVLPTKYRARTLEEFLDCLRKVGVDIIFYHFIESRLRLGQERGRYRDDFSLWIADSVGNKKLANRIASLDPMGFTPEGLKAKLVELVEKALEEGD